jgi:hypothetical protein
VQIDGTKGRFSTIVGLVAGNISMLLVLTLCCFTIRRMDSYTLYHSFVNPPSVVLSPKPHPRVDMPTNF